MYTKLFGSIVHSTIWREPDHVRLVWVTMLALADKNGCVWAAVPGLADAARVTIDQCEEAVKRLSEPDRYSRTQVAEGRRIEAIDGGWFLINHAKFQAIKNMDERREQVREAVRRHRAKADVSVGNQGNHEKSEVIAVSPSDQTIPDQTQHKKRASVRTPTVEEAEVIRYYLFVHPRRKAGEKEQKVVGKALALGYSSADLCEAIDGNAADVWHVERSKHELPYVLRDAGTIDNFRSKATKAHAPLVDDNGFLTPEAYDRLSKA